MLSLLLCTGFSLVAASGDFSLVVVHGLLLLLSMCSGAGGLQEDSGSIVMAHGLSCSEACGILPDQGLNACPLHWQVDFIHYATREVLHHTCLDFFPRSWHKTCVHLK